MSCPEAAGTRQRLRLREEDALSGAEQGLLNRHLSECAACSAEAVRHDPTLLFSVLGASAGAERHAPVRSGRPGARRGQPAETDGTPEAGRFVEDVLAAVEVERSRKRLHVSRRPLLVAASLTLLAAGLAGLVAVRGHVGKDVPAAETAALPPPRVLAAPETAASARPLIEDLKNPLARVYQFTGASPKEPHIVFIANPDADI